MGLPVRVLGHHAHPIVGNKLEFPKVVTFLHWFLSSIWKIIHALPIKERQCLIIKQPTTYLRMREIRLVSSNMKLPNPQGKQCMKCTEFLASPFYVLVNTTVRPTPLSNLVQTQATTRSVIVCPLVNVTIIVRSIRTRLKTVSRSASKRV
uniref:Uncharacterized protein n=1 Tax=Cacopsylla melanoneura TaxID=428564 RepID=A0A8D8YMY8_9HEMI